MTRRPIDDAQEIKVLRSELRTAQDDLKVARDNLAVERNLREVAENLAERLSEDNKRLREEIERMKGPFDPWQPCVEKFLAEHPDVYRHPSRVILRDALGIPERDHESAAFRRLARVMHRIGGWQNSPNIPFNDGHVRGWKKPRYG